MNRYSDGAWDCSHAYDPGMHYDAWKAIGRPTDPEAAINVVRKAWVDNFDDDGQSWIEANGADVIADSRGTVDPADEFKAWRDAWQARAVEYTRHYMPKWYRQWREDNGWCDVCGHQNAGHTCCP